MKLKVGDVVCIVVSIAGTIGVTTWINKRRNEKKKDLEMIKAKYGALYKKCKDLKKAEDILKEVDEEMKAGQKNADDMIEAFEMRVADDELKAAGMEII